MRQWTDCWLWALILGSAAVQVRAVEPDPCIPPDTIFAMKVRPRQILTSALVKDLGWDELFKTTLAAEGPVQEFLDTAGLRIDRDLESILFCMPSSPIVADPDAPPKADDPETEEIIRTDQPAGEKPAKPWLMVLRGKFSSKKITKALTDHGKNAGAPIRKLKGARTALLQIESEQGPIFVGFDGNRKIIVSNQLERLKGCLASKYGKPSSERFLKGMKGLTDKESLWFVQAVEADLKKQLKENPPDSIPIDGSLLKELNSCSFSMTFSDGIQGKLFLGTTTASLASSIKTCLTTNLKGIALQVESFLEFPKDYEASEDALKKAGEFAQVSAAFLAVKQCKMEVKGNDLALLIDASRQSLEPLIRAITIWGK